MEHIDGDGEGKFPDIAEDLKELGADAFYQFGGTCPNSIGGSRNRKGYINTCVAYQECIISSRISVMATRETGIPECTGIHCMAMHWGVVA